MRKTICHQIEFTCVIMETINTILGNTKSIMKNMSDMLQEIKNSVNERMKEQLEKVVLAYLKERSFHQNQISLQEVY
jgi:archaellum component FlaC